MGSISPAPDNVNSTSQINLPIIDISGSDSHATGRAMVDAAVRYGFLYISSNGTGMSETIVDNIFDLSKQFFSSDASSKEKCRIGPDNRGWTGMHDEILDPRTQRKGDFKEALNLGEFKEDGSQRGIPQQPMPDAFKDKEAQIFEFETLCKETCKKVLDLLALGLEVEESKFFSSRHTKPSGCTLRLLHYPTIPADVDYQPTVDIRAGAHSDYGSMTLLFQRPSQPGLEIRTPEETWAPVAVIPEGYSSKTFPPILVNIGDLMSYWTNGLLKSTVHRVIFPHDARQGGEDRYSIAFFCHPANDTELVPVPSRIVQQHRADERTEIGYGGGATSKPPLTAKEHLLNRLDATYGFRMNRETQAA